MESTGVGRPETVAYGPDYYGPDYTCELVPAPGSAWLTGQTQKV